MTTTTSIPEAPVRCERCEWPISEPVKVGFLVFCKPCAPYGMAAEERTEFLAKRTHDSRITRGIRLAAERADEFERVAAWTWIVPGCSGRETYTVDLKHSYCTCPDFQIRRSKQNQKPAPCKHVFSAEIVSAKTKARKRERVAFR